MARHQHDDHHEIIVVCQGQIETHIAGKILRGGPGSVLFYPRRLAHQEAGVGGAVLETLFVGFQAGAAGLSLGAAPIISFDQSGRIQALLRWMHELSPAARTVQQVTQAALLQALLYELASHPAFNSPAAQVVHTATQYMREHLAEPLRLADVARVVYLSPFHFSRLFRRVAGQSPMRFLAKCRVEAAHSLLRSSTLPMKAIARRTGLSDPFHFSRTFRRMVGYPPGRVRRPSVPAETQQPRRSPRASRSRNIPAPRRGAPRIARMAHAKPPRRKKQ